jgi:hypothetical protein
MSWRLRRVTVLRLVGPRLTDVVRPLDAVRGAVAYRSAKQHPEHEQRDICDEHDDLSAHPLAEAYEPSPEFEKIRVSEKAGPEAVAAKDIIERSVLPGEGRQSGVVRHGAHAHDRQ